MLKHFVFGTAIIFGSNCSAATLEALDLTLRLESNAFTNVEVYDENYNLIETFDVVNADDNALGIVAPNDWIKVGEQISLTATLEVGDSFLSDCSISSFSCESAFGELEEDTFFIGDGAGLTIWGDFSISGGRMTGDLVELATFEAGPEVATFSGGGLVTWGAYVQNFVVLGDDTDITPVPLPASLFLLSFGVGALGLFRRRTKLLR